MVALARAAGMPALPSNGASQSLTALVRRTRTGSVAHLVRKDLGGPGMMIGNCPGWQGLSLNLPNLCSARSGMARA